MFIISLRHLWTKETRSFEVEHVENTYVSIRWGQSGIYDLNLAKNVLTARSQKAQRKGKAHWEASNIQGVRLMVKRYIEERELRHTKSINIQESMQRHAATMPGK